MWSAHVRPICVHFSDDLVLNLNPAKLPEAGELVRWRSIWGEKRGIAHLLETAEWGEVCSCLLWWSLPSHSERRRSAQWTTLVRERNRVRLCLDWQNDWLHPISCCVSNMQSSHFRKWLLPPKHFERSDGRIHLLLDRILQLSLWSLSVCKN